MVSTLIKSVAVLMLSSLSLISHALAGDQDPVGNPVVGPGGSELTQGTAADIKPAQPTAEEVAEVDAWLDKMSLAMHQQNFRGTLVIRQQDNLQSIRVKQGFTPEGSWQTLESLSGEAQTIIRQNDTVTTVFPAKKLITVSGAVDAGLLGNASGSQNKNPLHSVLPDNRQALKAFYHLQLSGQDRVAGKNTHVLQMIPRDNHRYGYVFWLENQSGLLLKCDLMDEQGNVVEQLMYSDIELLSETPRNNVDMAALTSYKKINMTGESGITNQHWYATDLPAGFSLIRSVKKGQENRPPVYHMVYSDGMASVSVFIEQRKQSDRPIVGQSTMGSVNAYSSFMDNAYVTAIGEVPVSTVQMIAQSIRPSQ